MKNLRVKLEDGRILLFIEALKQGLLGKTVILPDNSEFFFPQDKFVEALAIATLIGNSDLVGYDGGNCAIVIQNGRAVLVFLDAGMACIRVPVPSGLISWGFGTPNDPASFNISCFNPAQQTLFLKCMQRFGTVLMNYTPEISSKDLAGLGLPADEIDQLIASLTRLIRGIAHDRYMIWRSLFPASGNTTPSLDDPPIELCCPVSLELFKDPVIVTSKGGQRYTYERSVIEDWFLLRSANRSALTNPLTNEEVDGDLKPDDAMAAKVNAFKISCGQAPRISPAIPTQPEVLQEAAAAVPTSGQSATRSTSRGSSFKSAPFTSALAPTTPSAPESDADRVKQENAIRRAQEEAARRDELRKKLWGLYWQDWRWQSLYSRKNPAAGQPVLEAPKLPRGFLQQEVGHYRQRATYRTVRDADTGLTAAQQDEIDKTEASSAASLPGSAAPQETATPPSSFFLHPQPAAAINPAVPSDSLLAIRNARALELAAVETHVCPLSLEIMRDPVTCPAFLVNGQQVYFDLEAIEACAPNNPLTGSKFKISDLRSDPDLRRAIQQSQKPAAPGLK